MKYTDTTFTRGVQIGVLHGALPEEDPNDKRKCHKEQVTDSFWVAVPFHIEWILKTISEH